MSKTCATCGWWKVECNRLRGVEHVLVRTGCCTACQGSQHVESALFTWADATCPAWAEREDAAARAALRIADHAELLRCNESVSSFADRLAAIIREEYAKEEK
jgi:hypothetical protein